MVNYRAILAIEDAHNREIWPQPPSTASSDYDDVIVVLSFGLLFFHGFSSFFNELPSGFVAGSARLFRFWVDFLRSGFFGRRCDLSGGPFGVVSLINLKRI